MFKKHEMIPSTTMGRPIHLWRYGHFGPPLLVFPSASGMAHEWDSHGMVEALSDYLDAGKLKLYTTESNVAEAWTRKENPAEWRIRRHRAFEHYVIHDLVPFIRADCQNPEIPIAVTGTSLGALYSVNFALKFPQIFHYALGLSGRYNATWLTDGFTNDDVYFNNPMAYVPNLHGDHLNAIREHTKLSLVCGQGKWEDGNIEDTLALAALLEAKGISSEADLWGHDVAHEWKWWKRQVRFHLEKSLLGPQAPGGGWRVRVAYLAVAAIALVGCQPTTGGISGHSLYYIANSHFPQFDEEFRLNTDELRDVVVLRLALE